MKKNTRYWLMETRAFFLFYLPAIFRVKQLLHFHDSNKGAWATDKEPEDKTNFWQL
jgi:hypothetical protein